jgi:putative ABC transport system ATP-binding protein
MILQAVDISRSYVLGKKAVQALAPLSLAIDEGDFLVITGPSGSGKSTLLNLLSGFDRASTGKVFFRNSALGEMADGPAADLRNRSFGFIYQTPHLLHDKTVLENVALPFHYGSWLDKREVKGRCTELLEYVGLADLASRYPGTLSGGEMQRVVFARALAREPQIIFADEPTGSLDSDNAEKIINMLKQQAARGCAVIMVTHDAGAARCGSVFLALKKNRVITPEVVT